LGSLWKRGEAINSMTTLFSLSVEVSASDDTRQRLVSCIVESGEGEVLPVIPTKSIRMFQSAAAMGGFVTGIDSAPLAAVFCPRTLVLSACEHDHPTSREPANRETVQWLDNPQQISKLLLSLIHPFLEHNFTIKGILTSQQSDIVLLDLTHTPRAVIVDLLDSTSCQVIFSGPEIILKMIPLISVQFTINEAESLNNDDTAKYEHNEATLRRTVDYPTCPVCLHRIDPIRLDLPITSNQHLCSKFCPPPNLNRNSNSTSCPRQRLLNPWPAPNFCEACSVIRKFWNDDAQVDPNLACMHCAMQETLWVCLTCAFVGCGRYSNKHAAQHNTATGHPFCLELSTLRIWSYVDGEFAHRADFLECPSSPPLLQPWIVSDNAVFSGGISAVASLAGVTDASVEGSTDDLTDRTSSKPSAVRNQDDYERMIALNFASVDVKSPKKARMVGEEYEALLQSALEEQVQHYEGEISHLRATLTLERADQESMTLAESAEIEGIKTDISSLRSDIERFGKDLLSLQAHEAGHRATSLSLLQEQRVMEGLLKKIREDAANEHERGRLQIEELEQQISDLTANKRMMQQFSHDEDLKNAQIFATEQSFQPKSRKPGKKGRKLFGRSSK
jgi:gas vesicle protein